MSKMLMISQRNFGIVLYLILRSMNLKLKVLTSRAMWKSSPPAPRKVYRTGLLQALSCWDFYFYVHANCEVPCHISILIIFAAAIYAYTELLSVLSLHSCVRGTQREGVKNVVWTHKHDLWYQFIPLQLRQLIQRQRAKGVGSHMLSHFNVT